MMNKLPLILSLGLSLAFNAFAVDDRLKELNSEIKTVLAPLQNESTTAQLEFNRIQTSENHVTQASLSASYNKIHLPNKLKIKIKDLYFENTRNDPAVGVMGYIDFDFTKLFSQEQINVSIPAAEKYLTWIVNLFAPDAYNDAVLTKSVSILTGKNHNNYTSLKAEIGIIMDLSKLPEDIAIEEVMISSVLLDLDVNIKTGIKIRAYLDLNPKYIAFVEKENLLKETLEKLLVKDKETLSQIGMTAQMLDQLVMDILEQSNLLSGLLSIF